MLILKGHAGLDRIFRTQARCADETVKESLQRGGFVYLEYNYAVANDQLYTVPLAHIADEVDGGDEPAFKKKMVYPVFIERSAPGTPREDFKPINESKLITVLMGTFNCFFNNYSYVSDLTVNSVAYGAITPGCALKIKKFTETQCRNEIGLTDQVGPRAMLVKGDGTFQLTVAYAESAPLSNNMLKVRWGW